jgi:hypothetical protein
MDKMLVGFLLFVALIFVLGGVPGAFAQTSNAATQLETCRQHVIQLTEQSRTQQTQLTKLRAERKAIGVSGGEMARFKLANLDQEIRDLTKQNQSVNVQTESETKRCDGLAAKASAGKR